MTHHYTQQYEALTPTLPGHSIGWVENYRASRLSKFKEMGFPTNGDEDWRYTSVRPITSKEFTALNDVDEASSEKISSVVNDFAVPELDSYRLIFVDGILSDAHSDLESIRSGVQIASIADVLNDRPESIKAHFEASDTVSSNGFTELNRAFSKDGIVVELPEGITLDKPLELLFLSLGNETLAQSRNLVIANKGSKAEIIERYVSVESGATLTNTISELFLAEHAEVDHYVLQTQSRQAYQVCSVFAKQAENSRFSCRTITLGGALVRNEIKVEMMGSGAHCDMFGLYSLSGKQHVDNHTTMIHGAPDCTSNELYKGVLNQRSRGVFHGRIKVEQDAQKTDAQQSNNTLLLSRDAEIDTKPQLEIYADDVKCSHGATIGQIDETSLFYLRSRGIDEADARSLLTFAFVNDVLKEVEIAPLKLALESTLADQLIREQ